MNINTNLIKFDNEIQKFKNIIIKHNKFVKFIRPEYSEIFKILTTPKFYLNIKNTQDSNYNKIITARSKNERDIRKRNFLQFNDEKFFEFKEVDSLCTYYTYYVIAEDDDWYHAFSTDLDTFNTYDISKFVLQENLNKDFLDPDKEFFTKEQIQNLNTWALESKIFC